MREDTDNPLFLIGDHLGSTSVVLDFSGQEVARQTYLPFGKTWGSSTAELPTDYTFTGQRMIEETELHFYVARWFDSETGHFVQADTVVPGAGNPLAWNRYAYVNYNPMINSDPSGHFTNKELKYIFGENYEAEIQKYSYQMQILLNKDDFTFGDMLIYNIDGVQHWGILIMDSNNSLAILDLELYTTISIGYDFEPIAAYDNQSKTGQ